MSLKRNTVWNLIGMGAPLLLGVVAIPYLYRKLGIEGIGILTLVWALIGYFSLFDFGLGRALTQQVSASRVAGQEQYLPGLVKSGLLFTGISGFLGGVLLAALSYPLAFDWLNVSKQLQQSAAQSLLIAAFGIPMTTITTGLRGVLEAYEDFSYVNLLRMLLGVSNFGLPMLSVMLFGPSLIWMISSLVAARFFILILHLLRINHTLPQGWRNATFSQTQLKKLFSFGAWMTVSNIIGPLMVTADRFIISSVLGASVVAFYSVPAEMLIRVLILPAALTSAIFPRLAIVVTTDINEAKRLYRMSLKIVTATLLPVCLLIALGSKLVMTQWLGPDFAAQSWVIVCILAFGLLLNGVAYVPFAAIHATGDAKTTAYIHIVELAIYVPLLLASMKAFGLIGAALAWNIRVAADLIALLICANSKKL